MNMIQQMIKLLEEPSIVEIVSSPNQGRTKFALQLAYAFLQQYPDRIVTYADSDHQIGLSALAQNQIDLERFFYLTNIFEIEAYIDILIIDSLPTILSQQTCSQLLRKLREQIRHKKCHNIIVLNQKRYNPKTQKLESFYLKYIKKFCDYSFDLDTNLLTQNILERINILNESHILPDILDTTWRY